MSRKHAKATRLKTDSVGRLVVGSMFAIVLAGCAPKPPAAPPPPTVVGVITVQPTVMTLNVELIGRTRAYQFAEVRPQVSGLVSARLFREGSNVARGQVLYQIEPAPYRAAYETAAAQLARADTSLRSSRLRRDRAAVLVKSQGVSQQEADDAQAAFDDATAVQLQARAALDSAALNLQWTKIAAPISGRIGASNLTEGALLTAGQPQPLATIQRLDPMYVDITESAAELLALKRALGGSERGSSRPRIRLKLEDGSDYGRDGALEFTDVTVDPTSGSVVLHALFPNPDGILLPGMFVKATVDRPVNRTVVLIPQRAVTRNARGEAIALVVNTQDRVEERVVSTAQSIAGKWVVTGGLKAGDRLVVRDAQKASPGDKVTATPVIEEGQSPPAPVP